MSAVNNSIQSDFTLPAKFKLNFGWVSKVWIHDARHKQVLEVA